MNKAITDGAALMPPAFHEAFGAYFVETGVGTPTTIDTLGTLIADDPDFGTCLELHSPERNLRLRYQGETPLLPGCYLRISARVKATGGPLTSVRIAGFAGGAGGVAVNPAQSTGPAVRLTALDQVTEVHAIVGPGTRLGVDMAWGPAALYGQFGLDITGPKGTILRVDQITIEDVTNVFASQMISQIDVRDFGAIGDGETDDSAAFEAANIAAGGRIISVPRGQYYLGRDIVLTSPARFEGQICMPEEAVLLLSRNFDLPSYHDAFGTPSLALRKGLQALMLPAAPNRLDMKGQTVMLSAPLVVAPPQGVQAAKVRKTLCNGRITALVSPDWMFEEHTLQAHWSPENPNLLTAAGTAAQIPVGARVTGAGVRTETYVCAKDPKAQTLTLNGPLGGGTGSRALTCTRFRYLLDFSAFADLNDVCLSNIELCGEGVASGVMLAPRGSGFRMNDCTIRDMRDRGLTSCGTGCHALVLDRSSFFSRRRTSLPYLGFNANAGGLQIVNCRSDGAHAFGHFAGESMLMTGSRVNNTTGEPHPGLILEHSTGFLLTGNCFDACSVVAGPDQEVIEPDGNLFSLRTARAAPH
ncbi:glycosyl hydrolase family 28-related protein [Roseobacter sp.]|uniref:glycosyl hydrolase family 28-related protein n=1 Tax=Roseobacter sp. TaxID=1907202 RepID=UPI003299CFEF